MANRLLTSPVTEPITIAEAKAHLRVSHSEDDAYIAALIAAARVHIETETNRALATQTWLCTLDEFPPEALRLEATPVQEVVSVEYDDINGDEQVMNSLYYFLDNENTPAWIVPTTAGWPVTISAVNTVRVTYIAGYDAAFIALPNALKQAMLLLVGQWYEAREAASPNPQSEIPFAVTALSMAYRVWL